MKIHVADAFFKSFKKAFIDISKPWKLAFWEDLWYNFKWSIWALITYHKIVKKMRPWESYSIFEMMEFQLKLLLPRIENGHEEEVSRMKKVKDIQRMIELLHNLNEENYVDRCGFDHNFDWNFVPADNECFEMQTTETQEQKEKNEKAINDGYDLEKKEMKELGKLFSEKMRSWWD